ncbi:hypothetical protein J6590_086582 [Homalodisca vitripennis]|nr:hypothetical protein J6590_086582 [Homalodisca vitripennis]
MAAAAVWRITRPYDQHKTNSLCHIAIVVACTERFTNSHLPEQHLTNRKCRDFGDIREYHPLHALTEGWFRAQTAHTPNLTYSKYPFNPESVQSPL